MNNQNIPKKFIAIDFGKVELMVVGLYQGYKDYQFIQINDNEVHSHVLSCTKTCPICEMIQSLIQESTVIIEAPKSLETPIVHIKKKPTWSTKKFKNRNHDNYYERRKK
jgi:hypothetical protein